MTKKLTATMLIAMAAKQGIKLVEAGDAAATPAAMHPADASLLAMREKRADDAERAMSKLVIECNGYKAEIARLTHILKDNATFVGEERDAMVARIADLTRERDEARALRPSAPLADIAKLQGERFALQGELSEARAQVAALERTVEKLRRAVLQAPAATVDEGNREEAKLANRESRSDQVATVTGIIRFHGPQGVGTADRIKAIGGRWKWNPKRADGSRSQTGYWVMPDSPETAELIAALRFEGKLFSEE